MSRVPAIRFEGFNDPWEQRKPENIFEIVDERGFSELPVLSATQDQGMILRDDSVRFIGHNKANETGYKRVKQGDFVIHLRSFQGGFAHSSIEGITSPAYTVFAVQEPDEHYDRFWKHWFMSPRFIDMLTAVTYGIRDGRSISVDEFMDTLILQFPSAEEQYRIGNLIDNLDTLITLHQRKYDKLRTVKKSMLDKMFPKPGELFPEIRFEGFTDPWEQRKVGDIFKITRGNVLPVSATSEIQDTTHLYPVYSSQTKNDGLLGYYNEYLFENGITWTTDGANAGTVRFRPGRFYSTNVNGVLLSDEGFANQAVAEAINMIAWKYVSHVGNPKLMNNVMADIEINLPISKKEMRQVSDYLNSLDTLITLHQRKLEQLHK